MKILHPVHWHRAAGEDRRRQPKLLKEDVVIVFDIVGHTYHSCLFGFSHLGPGWTEFSFTAVEDFWMREL